MSSVNPEINPETGEPEPALRVSQFDQVSSLLMALLLFVGFAVFFMFLIWLCDQLDFRGGKIVAEIVEEAAGRGPNAEGFERDFEPPGAEEVEELEEPTLTDTLQAVTDAVSTVAATLDSMNTDSAVTTQGTGQGDSRPPGPMGEGEDIIPRYDRWRLKFAANSMAAYATQLDFYGIELGAIGGSPGVDYASNLSGGARKRHNPDTQQEKRLYFRFTSNSPLQRWDRSLLSKARVNVGGGRFIMKFIPQNLENQLAQTEKTHYEAAGYKSVSYVKKTVFESRPAGNGFEFVIVEQTYRKPRIIK